MRIDVSCTSRTVMLALLGLAVACEGPGTQVGAVHAASDARGEPVKLRLVGWDDVEVALSAVAAVDVARPGGAGDQVVIASGTAVSGLDASRTEALRALFRAGVPVIAEGGEEALARSLGIEVSDPGAPEPGELLAVRTAGERLLRKRFIPVAPGSADASAPEARAAVLGRAMAWALRDPAPPVAARADDGGAWNSIPNGSQEWEWIGLSLDGTTIANVFTLTANGFKIQDLRPNKDWYLVDVRVAHEANADGRGLVSHPYCTHGEVGWYVESRTLKIERSGSMAGSYELAEYGPTGTIGSGSVSISLGGSLSTSDLGISGSWSKTYNTLDVTIQDVSSPFREFASWNESFVCPHSNYSLYPFHDDPADTSKSTFYSDRGVVLSTTELPSGVMLRFSPNLVAAYDLLDWPWWGVCLVMEVTRYEVGLGQPRDLVIFHNNAPDKPGTPSARTPVRPNEAVEVTVSGNDRDGDELTYAFDFGDGTVSDFGEPARSHTYTTTGTYGVRVKAMDWPHGQESEWSATFQVDVRTAEQKSKGGGGCASTGLGGGGWLLALLAVFAPPVAGRRFFRRR
jgi:hypothetical protein